MTTDLAIIPKLQDFATSIQQAQLLPSHLRGKPADLLLIAMTGAEIGLSPMQAIRAIHVIEGKPTLSADLMAALVMSRADVCAYLRPVELTATVATYETLRKGWSAPLRQSFTIDDATRAGLAGKDNWRKYPGPMLKARCLSGIVRAAYPDLMMGIYDPDELGGPVTIDAEVVHESPRTLKEKLPPVAQPGHSTRPGDTPENPARVTPTSADMAPTGNAPSVEEMRDDLVELVTTKFNCAPSRFREFSVARSGKDLPPVGEWDARMLDWALRGLRNGLAAPFRSFLEGGGA